MAEAFLTYEKQNCKISKGSNKNCNDNLKLNVPSVFVSLSQAPSAKVSGDRTGARACSESKAHMQSECVAAFRSLRPAERNLAYVD